ncbi:MAG TPA: HAMP domain-containing sensor histidine kinase [Blastocatellia bacterium]|nr:HAMP domain-containing sensor histidine kinase [Blastocatellia bacterium]
MEAAFEQRQEAFQYEGAYQIEADAWQMLAHDLRVPLIGVQKVLEMAIRDRNVEQDRNSAACGLLESAHANVELMLDMLTDILDLKHLRMGEFFIAKTPIEMIKVFYRCTDMLRFHAEEKNLTFRIQAQDLLPRVLADERRLVRILVNLLHNALKHSPVGEQVEIACRQESQRNLTVSVTDHGSGIPPDESRRIFSKGYSVSSKHSAEAGYGWGLYYCRLAIASLGGRIWIDDRGSGEEFGARVCFTLPTAD